MCVYIYVYMCRYVFMDKHIYTYIGYVYDLLMFIYAYMRYTIYIYIHTQITHLHAS